MMPKNRRQGGQLCLTRPPDHVEWIEGDHWPTIADPPPIAVGRRPLPSVWMRYWAALGRAETRLREGSERC